jgi:hypothetical protein
MSPSDTSTPISVYEQQIKTLQNDKLELKLELQHVNSLKYSFDLYEEYFSLKIYIRKKLLN